MRISDVLRVHGGDAFLRGEEIFRRGSVITEERGRLGAALRVASSPPSLVTLSGSGEVKCTCGEAPPCAHMIAAVMKAREEGLLQRMTQEISMKRGQELLGALAQAGRSGESARMLIALRLYQNSRVGLGLSMGQERLYAVRNIYDLLSGFTSGKAVGVAPAFTYDPAHMMLGKADESFLSLLASHMEPISVRDDEDEGVRKQAVPTDGRYVLPEGAFLMSVLRFLEKHPFLLMDGAEKTMQPMITTEELPLVFEVSQGPASIDVRMRGCEGLRLITPDGRYAVLKGRVIHLNGRQARVLRLAPGDDAVFGFPLAGKEETLALIMPALSGIGTVTPDALLAARFTSAPLKAKAYLDIQGGDVMARVEFCYGQSVLSPFDKAHASADETDKNAPLLIRDGRAEGDIMGFFSDAGFVVRGGRIFLRRARDILRFCTQGVGELEKLCEVYVSPAYERIKPRRFKASVSLRMRGSSLVFELLEKGRAVGQPMEILDAVRQRKQYVRLKTGEFLDIRDMTGLSPVAQELLDAAALDRHGAAADERELSFSAFRAGYLTSLLRMSGFAVKADDSVESAISSLDSRAEAAEGFIPKKLLKKLAPYQRRGSGWMLSLYDARMGGVLADEMGLGKTVQVIAALAAVRARDGAGKSVIVTPTSLIYHWLAEFKRFDESMVVRLISGQRQERRDSLSEAKADDTVDVLLTTYPLLRRDIELYRGMPLRFAILDEAQFVKNSQSLGAQAAKELDARVHIALTGTPMENHTGELWSIFDFALPGYLGTQSSFLRRYGGGERTEELRQRIRPFLMRRLKKDVLEGLPEKREHVMYAAMTPEQEKVYEQLMSTLRLHVDTALAAGSLPRARMQVLSLLLKLRQVCCHPKLFLPDYEGTSGKLELLISTLRSAMDAKRRILVFSQFVGMLQIIRRRLSREGVRAMYLDGDTKPALRQELCDRFNGGEGQVFLISLKAGGTGLNLTGADLVVHYDPWWNPAVEDQATDRAHRIGQSKDVDVIKLIAQGTIEEKVVGLSKRKRAVFDRVVLAGESALKGLTEEDIRALFF